MKIYTVKFVGVYPVGSCLIIAAHDQREAEIIASETIKHTKDFVVDEVVVDKPKVIEYLSGDY